MTLKHLSFAVVAAVFGFLMAACSGSKESTEENSVITVDELMANADNLVGDTVTIDGVCSHLCRHGGRKAFVMGSTDSVMIRCEAFPLMGEAFPKSVIRKPIQVTGVVVEERVDEAAVQAMEKQYAESIAQADSIAQANPLEAAPVENAATHESGCETERAAKGQKDITDFEARMADYRARIAAREASEGKPYLSFYYLNAISYEELPE